MTTILHHNFFFLFGPHSDDKPSLCYIVFLTSRENRMLRIYGTKMERTGVCVDTVMNHRVPQEAGISRLIFSRTLLHGVGWLGVCE